MTHTNMTSSRICKNMTMTTTYRILIVTVTYSNHGNHENSAKQLITMDCLLPDSPSAIYPTIF